MFYGLDVIVDQLKGIASFLRTLSVYYCRLENGDVMATRKMAIMK
jgi:hypothetical protein